MESVKLKFALHGSNRECTRTDNVFFPLYEISEGEISLCASLGVGYGDLQAWSGGLPKGNGLG